jgi:hypothetical protein
VSSSSDSGQDIVRSLWPERSAIRIKCTDVCVKGQTRRQVADALWNKFGHDTISAIREGSRYLAGIWQSAWLAGDGDHTIRDMGAIDTAALVELYDDRNFLPSKTLDTIGPLLQSSTPGPAHPRCLAGAFEPFLLGAASR